MLDKRTLKNQQISRRTFIISAGKLGLLLLLACRLFYMQFIKQDKYSTLSDKNRIRVIIIPPIRGQIFDRNQEIVAKNQTSFQLLLEKSGNPDYMNEIKLVSEMLELEEDQYREMMKYIKKAGHKVPAMIIDFLEWEEVSALEERKSELKSLFVDTGYNRYYPQKEACAHLIGYLGNQVDNLVASENFKIGKTGIESYYEDTLRGEFGYKKLEVNAHGRYVRPISTTNSIPGKDLKLNIDQNLQQQIQPLLSIQGCSAVIMDCTNGNIISLNSSPSYDPNKFKKLSQKYWNSLINNPHHPLINKATQCLYPPGSIFKIVVVLAALEVGYNPNGLIFCSGKSALGGNNFRCAKHTGHGLITLDKAIKFSCNSYIYAMAKQIGPNPIIKMAKMLGFGSITGIDIPGEKSGFVPDQNWKYEKFRNNWNIGDTLNLSIGQGYLLSTPIQLVRMMGAIASNGKLFTPNVAERELQYETPNIKLEHFNFIKSILYKVVNEPGGTGYRSHININGNKMAGKTGTAQVQAKKHAFDNLSRSDIAWNRRNHGIFSGYAPFDNPKYAITVYFDHGGSGGTAALIAKKIMEIIYGGVV